MIPVPETNGDPLRDAWRAATVAWDEALARVSETRTRRQVLAVMIADDVAVGDDVPAEFVMRYHAAIADQESADADYQAAATAREDAWAAYVSSKPEWCCEAGDDAA